MDSTELTSEQQFLLKEYDSAARLTYHIDELRNKLTSFFLTFTGAGGAALVIIVKGEQKQFFSDEVIACLFIVIAILGTIVVAILARCRRAQIEHFAIINRIRTYFLQKNYDLWNVVQLSSKTLPTPNRKSGTYMWTVLIILVTCGLVCTASFILTNRIEIIQETIWPIIIAAFLFLATYLLIDQMYFTLASPPPAIQYSTNNPPQ